MGCFGDREKGNPTYAQKWDFITLDDFRCTSFWTYFAYMWLWFMAIVSVAVYTVDTFTAVNLLVYDKWSSQVRPALDFKYSKWLFAACILLSWTLCFYEWIRALRVIQRGGVAQSYMDPLAATLQSMRSLGWKRFLVFSELTKSKKGTDYIALFAYFSFQGAIRVILAEGPRQGVNAMTLYAVFKADLLNTQNEEHHSTIEQFFLNIKTLANTNSEQAAIYFSMLFTLFIWVFSALSLITSVVLYLLFLWHYIPSQDGSLSAYCRRKIDKRLAKIVEHKVVAAMEEEERQHKKAEQKAELKRQKTGDAPAVPLKVIRQPTLPDLGKTPEVDENNEKLPAFPLARQATTDSVSTLPIYSSAPPSRNGSNRAFREPTLPGGRVPVRPGMPSRMGTQSSAWSNHSYSSDAPLLANAGFAGESDQAPPPMPAPTYDRHSSQSSFARPMPGRTFSQTTQGSLPPHTHGRKFSVTSSQGPSRFNTPGPRMNTPGSDRSYARGDSISRPPTGFSGRPLPARANTDSGFGPGLAGPPERSNTGFDFSQPSYRPPVGYHNAGYASEPELQLSPLQDPSRPFAPPSRVNTASPYRALPPNQANSLSNGQFGDAEHADSAYTPYNNHKSFTRKLPSASFNRPFTPAPDNNNQPSSNGTYEMTVRPSHSSSSSSSSLPAQNGGYVAFNPNMVKTSSTPVHSNVVHPDETATNTQNASHLTTESQGVDASHNAHTSTYGGILDDYGAGEHNVSRSPSPADLHNHAGRR